MFLKHIRSILILENKGEVKALGTSYMWNGLTREL